MIREATENDIGAIVRVWALSVQATHHFLPEDYFQHIYSLLPDILPTVPVYVYLENSEDVVGFLGVEAGKIEMLFIHPDHMGKGIGRKLLQFAVQGLNATKVDVNEHNEAATAFYRHVGFVVVGRSEVDGLGKPFPLLHMEISK